MIRATNYTLLIIFITIIQLANSQDDHGQHTPTSSNFQPSLFVVIGVLSFMFSLTSILLLYAKFCHRQASPIHNINQNQTNNAMFGYNTRFSGIDKKVVESLPFFKFSSLKGSKQGLQCAVCLAEFEEIETLRLLPKCKHGFHIECVDLWLEHHSTCPLCRQRVNLEDLSSFTSSTTSLRFVTGSHKFDAGDDDDDDGSSPSFELFLERENGDQNQNQNQNPSSRFILGGSFRRILSSKKDEDDELHIQIEEDEEEEDDSKVALHRLNHQIVVSDVVFKNRWSDVSSSDLMFLNSEMIGFMSKNEGISSNNLLNLNGEKKSEVIWSENRDDDDQHRIVNLRDEIERKRDFEDKIGQIKGCNSKSRLNIQMGVEDSSGLLNNPRSKSLISGDKRSMSEITALSRFKDLVSMKSKLRQCLADSEVNNSDNDDDYVKDDLIKRRKKWFPIAKRTVQWFANREKNSSLQQQQSQKTSHQTLDV